MRQTETSQKRYKYVGKERDEETGLYYYGFRYYAAWLCRFVSVDPLQFDYPHYTPFQYAGNKPITYIDLDGLEEALTPYMARVEYVETKNIFDASHNIVALLSNALIVGTYNASSGIINAVYNYEETGKAIANSRVGEYVKTAYNLGPNFANAELAGDAISFGGNVAKDLINTTWKDVGQAFTTWENYEVVVDLAVGVKGGGGLKTFGEEALTSEKAIVNVLDDVPTRNKFIPKSKFRSGEFGYFGESDDLGRLSKTYTDDLKLSKKDRLRHNPKTPGKLEGDHAGHLIGDRFGGSPNLDNLVSQLRKVNLSEYKKIENQWAKAIEAGKKVEIDISVNYKLDELRPASFDVNWNIDGESFYQRIRNK